ncbi:MAG: hypothetical protein KA206_00895 [Paludibacter sp.]|nr:hypothetical protein [Paludibacter sp.]
MKSYLIALFLIILSVSTSLQAAEIFTDSLNLRTDTTLVNVNPILVDKGLSDSLLTVEPVDSVVAFKPDPVKAVWLGAIIPGYGQIVNKSYWKLPIVYAGFLGCAYAISLNSTRYQTYKKAYFDKIDTNDNTNSYLNLPNGAKLSEQILKSVYDQYRRYRDLSIFFTVGYYAVTLIEAYVDAQLFDFDISSDISMHIRPALLKNEYGQSNKAGLQFSLNLK